MEVQFVELYQNIPRFADVARWLEDRGFYFTGFASIINSHASAQPIGQRSDGFPVAGDAVFSSRSDRFDMLDGKPRDLQLVKFAFSSLCTGHLAHCFASLNACGSLPDREASYAWLSLLHDLQDARMSSQSLSPPRFPDVLPDTAVKSFSGAASPAAWLHILDVTNWRASCGIPNDEIDGLLDHLQSKDDSRIEHVLRKAGFVALADKTNLMRRDHASKLSQFLEQSERGVEQ